MLRALAAGATPQDYRLLSATLGQKVVLHLPDGSTVQGVASEVDAEGRLVVGGTPYAAGDVVHLR